MLQLNSLNLSSPKFLKKGCKNLPLLLFPWSKMLHRLYGVDALGRAYCLVGKY